eukprot:3287976-Pleurochrysis_carterae.AAC.3
MQWEWEAVHAMGMGRQVCRLNGKLLCACRGSCAISCKRRKEGLVKKAAVTFQRAGAKCEAEKGPLPRGYLHVAVDGRDEHADVGE